MEEMILTEEEMQLIEAFREADEVTKATIIKILS